MTDKIFETQRIIAGCMRLNKLNEYEAEKYIDNAIENNVCYFDHADIYGGGECVKLFGSVLKRKPSLRDKMIIQTKTGIVRGKHYDLSKEHILETVDNSLKNLNVDTIDFLLLHRHDVLCEPQQIAEAFDILSNSGKVKSFGVSNHTPYQIERLKKYVKQPIKINQLQLSITNASMISSGICVNTSLDGAVDRDGGVMDYCALNDIVIQTWSPLQYGTFSGVFLKNEKFPELNSVLEKTAEKYGVTPATIAMAWILKLPSKMQVVCGTTNLSHFKDAVDARNIDISRAEWYEIYKSAGHILP